MVMGALKTHEQPLLVRAPRHLLDLPVVVGADESAHKSDMARLKSPADVEVTAAHEIRAILDDFLLDVNLHGSVPLRTKPNGVPGVRDLGVP